MNKSIFTVVIVVICTFLCVQKSNAQTVVVQTNNGTTQTQTDSKVPNVKYINGIPSTEDVGGVDIQYEKGTPFVRNYRDAADRLQRDEFDNLFIKLTNYNNFPVTVYYEMSYKALDVKAMKGSYFPSGDYNRSKYEKGKIVLPPAVDNTFPSKWISPTGDFVMTSILEFSTVAKRLTSR